MREQKVAISNFLSRKLRVCSFVGAVLVVLIHVPHPDYARWSVSWWIVDCFADTITRVAVPFFFFCSGLLLFRSFEMNFGWWSVVIAKRVRSLLVPFFIANGVLFVYCTVRAFLGSVIYQRGLNALMSETIRGFISATGIDICTFPLVGATWYIRNLFLLAMLSPLVYVLVARRRAVGIVILAFAAVLWMSPLSYDLFFRVGFSLEGLFFFALGAFVSVDLLNVRHTSAVSGRVAFSAMLAALPLGFVARCTDARIVAMILKNTSIIVLLVAVWRLYDYVDDSVIALVDKFSGCSFWVYLYQFLPFMAIGPLLRQGCYFPSDMGWLVVFGVWIMVIVALIWMAWVLKSKLPWAYMWMTGGR